MRENKSFNRRAVLAGPAGFRKALVEGINHYIAQAMEVAGWIRLPEEENDADATDQA